ncbi:hypothetical protein Pmani_007881 [Petrolisthes manimaculis]|uniref:Uncharacterized protein n=1 Tax=Petrolisthes manimaculis TaxID=1843537 RepID=A0AAE1UJL2_9EUCA|nr:hypothetical protein Pmani_007881 [Petrolisthes manimaculis]
MSRRCTARAGASGSVRASPSGRRHAPLATSTPSLLQRRRRPPQSLTDSAIGRELELSVYAWDSDQTVVSGDSDPNWPCAEERFVYTTEEDYITPAQPLSQVSEPPGSVISELATSAVPVKIPSTSRGILGALSPIAGPSGACGSSTRSVAAPSPPKRKRRLHCTSSSSSGEDTTPPT